MKLNKLGRLYASQTVYLVEQQLNLRQILSSIDKIYQNPLRSNAVILPQLCVCGGRRGEFGRGFVILFFQSKLPRPIPRNSVESDHGCISRINFDNADNVALTLYSVTLTSQKPCKHNNKYDCCKTDGSNDVYVFSIKYRYSDILLKKHKLHLFR